MRALPAILGTLILGLACQSGAPNTEASGATSGGGAVGGSSVVTTAGSGGEGGANSAAASGGQAAIPCPGEYDDGKCDDGKACNGVETCDTSRGQCVAGTPIVCDDDNICNGIEGCDDASGDCTTPVMPQCPKAPSACGQSGGIGSPAGGKVVPTSAAGFRLVDSASWTNYDAIIKQIEAHPSTTSASVADIVAGALNRSGNSINVSGLGCFFDGFEWNNGDGKVDYWWPQGVTGSTDPYDNNIDKGKLNGRRVMMVSWYHKAQEDPNVSFYKGVRVSIVDHTSTQTLKYRHVLLVEPVMQGNTATYRPLASGSASLHAGGIAWVGDYLYVAATSSGFKVFDTTRIMHVATGDKKLIGYQANKDEYHGYNYGYVMPQIGEYQLCASTCCARFSFVSLDSSTSPKSLLAGEYVSGSYTGRLHRWPLDDQTDRLLIDGGGVQSSEAVFAGVSNMQGAMSYQGTYFVSSSKLKRGFKPSPGSFHHGKSGGSMTKHRYPYLPEDLYFAKYSNEIWTCTESPNGLSGNTRYCFSFLRSQVQAGCD
jgi:hypothetical protein